MRSSESGQAAGTRATNPRRREEVLAEAQRIPDICVTARNIAGDQLSLADGRISLSLPEHGPIGPGLVGRGNTRRRGQI